MEVKPRRPHDEGPVSLADRAYSTIRDWLITLEIAPNAAIDDDALAEALDMGRTPVREALKRLEGDRLVVTYPRRGTFATGVDITDLAQISDIRVLLEPLAARRAAERATRSDQHDLRDLGRRLAALDLATVDNTAWMRWDLDVHRTIYRVAANPHLQDVLVRYHNLATRIFCLFLDRLPTANAHVVEHVHLLEVIAAGDAEEAARGAEAHIRDFDAYVRSAL